MRVALITPYVRPVVGGISTYMSGLSNALEKKGCEVLVIANQGKEDNQVRIVQGSGLRYSSRAQRLLDDFQPDMIHCHAHWYTLLPARNYRRRHRSSRVIFTFHTEPVGTMGGFKRRSFQWMLNGCDCVTFVSRDLEKKVAAILEIKAPKKVVYSGVNIPSFDVNTTSEFIKKRGLDGASPILSFIGPLEWENKVEGVLRLVGAFAVVKKENPKAYLIIVGDGKYRESVESRIHDHGLSGNAKVLGYMQEVGPALGATDIYTHISLQEGLPLSVLEAMGAGKPVVAASTGGIPELISHDNDGILTEPEPAAIAKSILGLWNDKQKMKSLGNEARKKITEKFTWAHAAEQYIDLYGGN